MFYGKETDPSRVIENGNRPLQMRPLPIHSRYPESPTHRKNVTKTKLWARNHFGTKCGSERADVGSGILWTCTAPPPTSATVHVDVQPRAHPHRRPLDPRVDGLFNGKRMVLFNGKRMVLFNGKNGEKLGAWQRGKSVSRSIRIGVRPPKPKSR